VARFLKEAEIAMSRSRSFRRIHPRHPDIPMRAPLTILAGLLTLQACSGEKAATDTAAATTPAATTPAATTPPARTDTAPTAAKASAPMRGPTGNDLGTLTLTDSPQGITLTGRLAGLKPGPHGIHIHMVGQCQPPFTSAGAHWNPTTKQHGSLNPQGPHLGDIPNITVGADSVANIQVTSAGGTLHGANALLDSDGAAVVVHALADDLRTDPSGNSGDRVGCGVVTAG
jgi:Cu-Zn family superoxide dismutase